MEEEIFTLGKTYVEESSLQCYRDGGNVNEPTP